MWTLSNYNKNIILPIMKILLFKSVNQKLDKRFYYFETVLNIFEFSLHLYLIEIGFIMFLIERQIYFRFNHKHLS